MTLSFSNLVCKLGGKEVLRGISGAIEPGKLTAILGPNGCGKSTWLRALLGLVPLEKGSFSIISAGYLPQRKEVYWPLTCEAIVSLGGEKSARAIAQVMDRLQITHLKEKPIDEVSGGERTLVLLARALRDRPKFIIADEPVAELDPKYQVKVMRILKEEAAAGAAVLVTMHDIQLTARFADFVFLMKQGAIIRQGSIENCFRRECLEDIFGVAFTEQKGFYAE